jgi:RES domain-containing protein
VQIWRISKQKHAQTAFSGEGARRFGGRWNQPGVAMVYCANSLSLAALETFVHMEIEDAANLLVAIPALIPNGLLIETLSVTDLPSNWRNYPAPSELADLGNAWLNANTSAVLQVPSAVIPREANLLLNPNHSDFTRIEIGTPEPFAFDPRLWKE